jgi:hypothetical protein
VVGGELHLTTSGWDGVREVRLEHRHGIWVGARALLNPTVLRLDGVDHVRERRESPNRTSGGRESGSSNLTNTSTARAGRKPWISQARKARLPLLCRSAPGNCGDGKGLLELPGKSRVNVSAFAPLSPSKRRKVPASAQKGCFREERPVAPFGWTSAQNRRPPPGFEVRQ